MRQRAKLYGCRIRSGNVEVTELLRVQPLGTQGLRNDGVATPIDVKAIDGSTTEQGADIGADLLHGQPKVGNAITVQHKR